MKTILQKLKEVKKASLSLFGLSIKKRNKIIGDIGKKLFEKKELIITENKKDLEMINKSDYIYDRLLLTDSRIKSMIDGCLGLIEVKDPLEKYSLEEEIKTKDGLKIKKQAIPLGVVSCIYEARPNVTIDLVIFCIKSGNAVVLRGGSQSKNSNNILVKIVKEVLKENNILENIIYNFPLKREKLDILYNAVGLVDVIIPRGGRNLIDSVRKKSLIPIIETGAGVVHLYLDDKINTENFNKAIEVIINAKTNRISVCNALDTLIINKNLSNSFIELLFNKLIESGVNIIKESNDINYFKEQLSLDLNIKFVDNLDEAIKHIQKYSTKHSDGILSDDLKNIKRFHKFIDSSVVYTNTSTRFSDGDCFGFAGEIGISTQKLHARGPMGVNTLVTYKYNVVSDWKIRN